MKIVDTGTLIGDLIVGTTVAVVVMIAIGFMIWIVWKAWRGE